MSNLKYHSEVRSRIFTSVGGFLHEYEHRLSVGEYNDVPGH